MTFYVIIFGFLFIGTTKVLFLRAVQLDFPRFLEAATLCLLVFSDVIFTSHMIEELKKKYKVWMKMTDAVSFLLLTGAVLATHPEKENFLDIDVAKALDPLKYREPVFWMLLAIYMGCLVGWNIQCGTYTGFSKKNQKHQRNLLIQPGMALLFLIMCLASFEPGSALGGMRLITCALTALYLLKHKTWLMRQVEGGAMVILKRLTAGDVTTIQSWPPYPADVAQLDYALRAPDGWLFQFPEAPETRRYAAWIGTELVGFSILTHITDRDAEFYVAVHPRLLHRRIGRALTEQTVAAGFEQLWLERIYLKVRDWHIGAESLYESVGFVTIGEVEEPIQGKPTKFVAMEILRRAT